MKRTAPTSNTGNVALTVRQVLDKITSNVLADTAPLVVLSTLAQPAPTIPHSATSTALCASRALLRSPLPNHGVAHSSSMLELFVHNFIARAPAPVELEA